MLNGNYPSEYRYMASIGYQTFSSVILEAANLVSTDVILRKSQSSMVFQLGTTYSSCNDWLPSLSPILFLLRLLRLAMLASGVDGGLDLELNLLAPALSAPLPGPELLPRRSPTFTLDSHVNGSILAALFPPIFPRLIVPPIVPRLRVLPIFPLLDVPPSRDKSNGVMGMEVDMSECECCWRWKSA